MKLRLIILSIFLLDGLIQIRGYKTVPSEYKGVLSFDRSPLKGLTVLKSSERKSLHAVFEKFSEKSIKCIMLSREEARRSGMESVATSHLLIGLIAQSNSAASKVLKDAGFTIRNVRLYLECEKPHTDVEKNLSLSSELPFSYDSKHALENGLYVAKQLNHLYVNPLHILIGLLTDKDNVVSKIFESFKVDINKLKATSLKVLSNEIYINNLNDSDKQYNREQYNPNNLSPFFNRTNKNLTTHSTPIPTTPTLAEYSTDLTYLASQDALDPVVGRDAQINRVVQILCRRNKSNPILIGAAGVGKSAIAEGLAQRIHRNEVPSFLANKRLVVLDVGLLVAGAKYRGEFEERIRKVLEEVRTVKNIILVIDEIHTLVGAGAGEGALDAANMLKPALARSDLQCIGATTIDEFRTHFEKDAALERRFQPVDINPASAAETVEILEVLAPKYEQFHGVRYTHEALTAAVKLSERYLPARHLPDKAIDLLDEAGAKVKILNSQSNTRAPKEILDKLEDEILTAIQNNDLKKAVEIQKESLVLEQGISSTASSGLPANPPFVETEHVSAIISAWTKIPLESMTQSDVDRLNNMENFLRKKLISQDEAVKALSRALRRARSGIKDPKRPIASFLFCGPTGVGKTEMAKNLAEFLFDSKDVLVRFDMSELMEKHSVSKLVGSPPGYVGFNEGGQLTEAVRRKPYSILLLDEIEKAHPDVLNLLLQVLDDGRLTDASGKTVDFKNTVIIMTSNAGSKCITKGGSNKVGFDLPDAKENQSYDHIKSAVENELKGYFKPEFLNRVDDIVVFQQLSKDALEQILDLYIAETADRCRESHNLKIVVTPELRQKLISTGSSDEYGARPLRRAVVRLVDDKIAEALLDGRVSPSGEFVVDVEDAEYAKKSH